MKRALFLALSILGTLATVPGVHAQFPGITLPGFGGANGAEPASPGIPVSDAATEMNTYIIAISESVGGMYGGFDPTLELMGDLEQLVSSNEGLPLDMGAISGEFPVLWPGYSNGTYDQDYSLGSPEGNWLTTLGTQEGALEAAADQQASQPAELDRLRSLEVENATAAGVLQALEVSNEISLFGRELEMKQRDATNASLNALVVAESNRQNKQAQDDLESLAVATQQSEFDLANMPDEEPVMPVTQINSQVTE